MYSVIQLPKYLYYIAGVYFFVITVFAVMYLLGHALFVVDSAIRVSFICSKSSCVSIICHLPVGYLSCLDHLYLLQDVHIMYFREFVIEHLEQYMRRTPLTTCTSHVSPLDTSNLALGFQYITPSLFYSIVHLIW